LTTYSIRASMQTQYVVFTYMREGPTNITDKFVLLKVKVGL